MGWAGKVVSVGALVGMVTSLLGSLLAQSRIYVTLGRQYLLSPWLVSSEAWLGQAWQHASTAETVPALPVAGELRSLVCAHAPPAKSHMPAQLRSTQLSSCGSLVMHEFARQWATNQERLNWAGQD